MPSSLSRPIRGGAIRFALSLTSGLVSLGALSTFPTESVAAVSPSERRFSSSRFGVSVEAPAGWNLSQHTGYADTLVLLVHPDGSRISVTVAGTSTTSAAGLYEQNRPGFAAQGLVPAPIGTGVRESFAVDLTVRGRAEKVRQLYLVRQVPQGHQAIVLTLTCRSESFAARLAALDFVAMRMSFEPPLLPVGPSRNGSGLAGGGGRPAR